MHLVETVGVLFAHAELHVIVEHGLGCLAVAEHHYSLPMPLVIDPRGFDYVSVGHVQFALPVSEIVVELALEDAAVLLSEHAVPLLPAVDELAFVGGPVHVSDFALAVLLSRTVPFAFVGATGLFQSLQQGLSQYAHHLGVHRRVDRGHKLVTGRLGLVEGGGVREQILLGDSLDIVVIVFVG